MRENKNMKKTIKYLAICFLGFMSGSFLCFFLSSTTTDVLKMTDENYIYAQKARDCDGSYTAHFGWLSEIRIEGDTIRLSFNSTAQERRYMLGNNVLFIGFCSPLSSHTSVVLVRDGGTLKCLNE